MMELSLNGTRQEDLYQRACQDMASQIPGWTDQYPSDPAVAVLEHLTYLSDVQNDVLNQVQDAHYLAYLKLLGETVQPLTPARLLALPDPAVPCAHGQRFFMDGVPFEVSSQPRTDLPQIAQVALEGPSGRGVLTESAPLRLEGNTPATLTILLTGPLPAGVPLHFWYELVPQEGCNPPGKDTTPPVIVTADVRVEGEWQTVPCEDHTCGFLKSGSILVTPEVQGDAVAFHITGTWEGTPQLQKVVLEPLELVQQQTRSICMELTPPFRLPKAWLVSWRLFCFAPEGGGWRKEEGICVEQGCLTGWTGQPPAKVRVVALEPDFPGLHPLSGVAEDEVLLDENGVWSPSLQVMVEENGLWYDCPVRPPEADKTLPRGCRWVEEDRCLCFGDGRDYLPPRPGKALIAGCILTQGGVVNGAMGTLTDGPHILTALTAIQGGLDQETPKDAFFRAAQIQEEPLRAVTCRDYETLAKRTPGLALKRVRALPGQKLGRPGPGVVVLAMPSTGQPWPVLNQWQRQQLVTFLEPFRLLGVPLEVRGPRYCPICIRATLQTTGLVEEESLRLAVLPLADGVTGPLDFGAEVSYHAIFAALGAIKMVRSVQALELTPLADGVSRTQDGSIVLAPDMLACLTELEVTQL